MRNTEYSRSYVSELTSSRGWSIWYHVSGVNLMRFCRGKPVIKASCGLRWASSSSTESHILQTRRTGSLPALSLRFAKINGVSIMPRRF